MAAAARGRAGLGIHRSGAGGPAGTSSAPRWPCTCSAPTFDVQGGGRDLIFPHHEMCAAEGRVATGEEFARAYLHAGMVGLDGEKMSKSKGNLVFVSELRSRGVDPMVIRLALLSHHYREDWMWTEHELDHAAERLDRWREAVRLDAGLNADEVLVQVRAALAHDLDAPTALAAVDAWAGARRPSTATTPTPRVSLLGSATVCSASASIERVRFSPTS